MSGVKSKTLYNNTTPEGKAVYDKIKQSEVERFRKAEDAYAMEQALEHQRQQTEYLQQQQLNQQSQAVDWDLQNRIVNNKDYSDAVNRIDTLTNQPGFGLNFIREAGRLLWDQGQQLPPDQLVKEAVAKINEIFPAQKSNVVKMPKQSAPQYSQKPVIPNVGNKASSSSPVATIDSIKDLDQYEELARQAERESG